jgi:hypothetical protein
MRLHCSWTVCRRPRNKSSPVPLERHFQYGLGEAMVHTTAESGVWAGESGEDVFEGTVAFIVRQMWHGCLDHER